MPALVSMAGFSLIWAWVFARRIEVCSVDMSWSDSVRDAGGMVRLALAFMWNGVLGAAAVYITRALITREISLEAVGLYGAAFALSGMFVNFVLQAMSMDYYPRLTAVAEDREKLNALVNEQTEIGLLLAIPGLLLTISLAPWVIRIFYTAEFLPSADLLQWFALGCLGRVISWPVGFIMLAMGKGGWYAATQTLFHLVHLCMIWAGLIYVGIEGVAIAFLILYVFSTVIVLYVARHLSGFRWSKSVVKLLLMLIPIALVTFVLSRSLSIWSATAIGLIIFVVASLICLQELINRIGLEHSLSKVLLGVPGMRWFVTGTGNPGNE